MNQCRYLKIIICRSLPPVRLSPLLMAPVALVVSAFIGCIFQCNRLFPHSAITASGIPPISDSLKRQMEQYQNWRFASLVDWLPDGSGVAVLGRTGETSQLFTVSGPGDTLRQLSFLNESVISAGICPDPARRTVLFTHDSGGDEKFSICALDFATSDTTRLTHDSAQNDGIVWSNRGDRFAYSSNRRNGIDFDIYIAEPHGPGGHHLALSTGGNWTVDDWSFDDGRLLVSRYVSRTSSLLYIHDRASGALTPLIDTCDTVSQELGAWGPDGRGVFYTSDLNTDFRCLHYRDLTKGYDTSITSAIPWDVREIALSRDRKRLAFTTNEHGFSQLYLMDAVTFARIGVLSLPRGIIGTLRFHPSGALLAMTVNTPRHPDDVYVLDLNDLSTKRWTNHDPAGIASAAPVQPDIVEYPTFDSIGGKPRLIPCLIYKPIGRSPPFPALIMIHGGPETQFWPSFRPEVNFYLAALGIAVIAPNVRGSGGYGKKYLMLDNGMRRKDAVRDIGALLDWIARQPDLDTSRIAVTGGSYGGYMALASMARYGEKLRAGIDCYGIGNFITFLESTASYRRDLRRVEYGDERDPAMRKFLMEISPLTHADRITKPLLIIQGANDPRVPLSESQQIAATVRKNGGIVWFLTAGDEGHGFRKKSNKEYQEWATALFLKEFIGQAGSRASVNHPADPVP